ncbi:hypothetical protein IEU95_11100 [Hoyosella rhizosphaerae]|uniref:Uncharacterized protein n=1 Tax=Hoyosella rhizosphaerae TaxID=1755582 RepID=A0A916TY47_9ACTN|nr:hypothetical protein [Hoyosella rhizosphaerae]MBN4927382.1 hypothetical protein [Hoyosella rhizosphaerae]GGC51711.1 hypothetical protein GCM10011410_00010 [Hoyosella rhizosphaerae]
MPDPSASNQLPEPGPAVPHVPDYNGGPSSGEIQMRYACEEGYAIPADCDGLNYGG